MIVELYHNDAIKQMDIFVERGLMFDAIIADLPYQRTANGWDKMIPFIPMWDRISKLIKPDGAVVLFSDGMFTSLLKISNQEDWKYDLTWDKIHSTGFLNASHMPLRIHETISLFYKKSPTYNPQKTKGKPNHSKNTNRVQTNYNYGKFNHIDNSKKLGDMKFPTSIIRIPKVHSSKTIHATQKPVELMEYLVKTFTNAGDTVLDFVMGSGSVVEACVNLDRNVYGNDNGICEKRKVVKGKQIYGKTWMEVVKIKLGKAPGQLF